MGLSRMLRETTKNHYLMMRRPLTRLGCHAYTATQCGLKEKLLAALRGGIKTVIIPEENEKDLAEIPDNVKRGLEIIPVATVDDVLHHALVTKPQAIELPDAGTVDQLPAKSSEGEIGGVVTH